jgi:mRNA-degrading endonuclease RelE of RelBE toxin-antitoxin system
MRTVVESSDFQKQAAVVWTEEERLAFVTWIALHPTAGDVIPGSKGARKVRWGSGTKGKRGGVRVIYFNLVEDDLIYLLAMYTKSECEEIPLSLIHKSR